MKTPFTTEQVESLNAYQCSGAGHPFTCGQCDNHDGLIATTEGWMCPDCDYTQDWCWEWMANWKWREMFPTFATLPTNDQPE